MASELEKLFVYPFPAGARPDRPRVMTWPVDWWLRSEMRLLGVKHVRAVAFDLFCIAQGEDPVGTLPTDERLLARLTGETLESWQRLMWQDPHPLWGWELCRCEGAGVRYYHPKCLEIAQEAHSGHGAA